MVAGMSEFAQVEVTQADREASRWHLIWCANGLEGRYAREVGEGLHDGDEPVQSFAAHRLASEQSSASRIAVLEEALRAVIDATCRYLPPDGISAQECISLVLGATDNPKINHLLCGKGNL